MKAKSLFSFGKILVVMVLLSQVQTVAAQSSPKDYLSMDYSKWMVFIPGNDSVAPYYISTKPVTNKEYILFLAWTASVYGANYPEVLRDLLPGTDTASFSFEDSNPFTDSLTFRSYLETSRWFISHYMFNSLYLNAPVIGITWAQANKFCHWLSDRYNEYSLIKGKYLREDPYQKEYNNFTTESFIFNQYEGIWGSKNYDDFFKYDRKGFDCVNNLLRPSFHIATQYELIIGSRSYNLVDCFCQEPKGSEFLDPFFKYYLRNHKDYIYFDPEPESDENKTYYMDSNIDYTILDLPKKTTEWCLDSYQAPGKKTIPDIYRNYGYDTLGTANRPVSAYLPVFDQKDSLGLMQCIITGESLNRELEVVRGPVSPKGINTAATPYIFDYNTQSVVNQNGDRYTTFRFSVNAVRKPVKK